MFSHNLSAAGTGNPPQRMKRFYFAAVCGSAGIYQMGEV
jgi:hypothetical protein